MQCLEELPGTMCAQICDPAAPSGTLANDCQELCARCVSGMRRGRARVPLPDGAPGACRPSCVVHATDRGACRKGYACDPETGTCMEACTSDAECQLFDAPEGSCDAATGRCRLDGRPGITAGDPCVRDADCMDDGRCLADFASDDGYCVRFGCSDELPCPGGDACDVRAFGDGASACLDGCRVGDELELATPEEQAAAILGPLGHSPSCELGQSCRWDGVHEHGDSINGSCVPGNYNDVTEHDVGTLCTGDRDCHSPFGLGRCAFAGLDARLPGGLCVTSECALSAGRVELLAGATSTRPLGRWASALCDLAAGDRCVYAGSHATVRTQCMRGCGTANVCPPRYACPVGDRETPPGVCWPWCHSDEECRDGARCLDGAGVPCGSARDCVCSA